MHSLDPQSRWRVSRWPPAHVPRSPSTNVRDSKGDPSTTAGRSPTSSALASMNVPHQSSRAATAGRCARTPHSRAAAWCCARASTHRSRRWVGTPEQRCWVERERVAQDRSDARVPSVIIGAVIGGISGHQIGGGTGRDVATVGGAVAGAGVGAKIARDRNAQQIISSNVQRCTTVPSQAHPDYWDVTYTFRGIEHSVQMTAPPGATVTVNRQGEPRG
jgi:uncharacterized protein YcfJ